MGIATNGAGVMVGYRRKTFKEKYNFLLLWMPWLLYAGRWKRRPGGYPVFDQCSWMHDRRLHWRLHTADIFSCRRCVYNGVLDIPGQFWNPNPPGPCDLIDACIQSFCMLLKCEADHAEADNTSQDACCRRLRLEISATYAYAGSVYGSGTGSCTGLDNVKEFPPDSCDCDPDVSAVFSFNVYPLALVDPSCGTVPPCVLECAANITVTI